MSLKTGIRFSESAVADMNNILAYYEEQGVPATGQRLVAEIVAYIETLAHHPDIGRIVSEFNVTNLRELIHPPFRIVYRCDANKIRIIRVWRSESVN
ncbi:MAG: type II toxin-antitoxin system RelE/ParE family toxin [Pseudomonadota bacterium]